MKNKKRDERMLQGFQKCFPEPQRHFHITRMLLSWSRQGSTVLSSTKLRMEETGRASSYRCYVNAIHCIHLKHEVLCLQDLRDQIIN